MKTKYGVIASACMVVVALAGPALAAGRSEADEQSALQGAALTLSQAIATAEQLTGGKAYDAGVDIDHGTPRIVVETNGPGGVQSVTVDVQSGRVVGSHAGGEADNKSDNETDNEND